MIRTSLRLTVISLLLSSATAPVGAGERALSPTADILISLLEDSRRTGSTTNMSPRLDRQERLQVAGAECPTGSGSYCGDELPYCCPGVNVAAYCAKDVNGCTQ
jgi:hypothetical protein